MQISLMEQAATMTSREISELVQSPHDSVLRTVRRLIAEGVVFGTETLWKHPQNGQTYPEFILDYRNTMVVTSGYSPALRAKIVDRWQELKVQAQQALELSKVPKVVIPQNEQAAVNLANLANRLNLSENARLELAKAAVMADKSTYLPSFIVSKDEDGVQPEGSNTEPTEAAHIQDYPNLLPANYLPRVVGIDYNLKHRKWVVTGTYAYLGMFDTKDSAILARAGEKRAAKCARNIDLV